jgi:hypothetical protein
MNKLGQANPKTMHIKLLTCIESVRACIMNYCSAMVDLSLLEKRGPAEAS